MTDLRKEPNNLPQSVEDIWLFCPKQKKWVLGYATRRVEIDDPFDLFFCHPYGEPIEPTHWAYPHDYPPPTPEQ
jgi:hypothetical protein